MKSRLIFKNIGLIASFGVCLLITGAINSAQGQLFQTDLPGNQWLEFKAEGFSEPVSGVIYRLDRPTCCGMPLGGIDTGCIDLETNGLWGYSTIFNTIAPRRGPLNLPVLGMSVDGQCWVLCKPKPKPFVDQFQGPVEPVFMDLKLERVKTAQEIHYWGHYPVVDMEYEIDAPIGVGMRAWAPFIPGDIENSVIPAMVFEVHLRNHSNSEKRGTVAFSFPGPTANEAGLNQFKYQTAKGPFNGLVVQAPKASYALGVIGKDPPRVGGEIGANGTAWSQISASLPKLSEQQPGASVTVDFVLESGQDKTQRFVLAWHSPQFNSDGYPASKEGRLFTHMYAKYYPTALSAANKVAQNHESLLKRILAWQQVIFTDKSLPVWLRESLVNNLHLFAETGLWVQALPPVRDWVRPEDGLFGLHDAPRHCPGIECIPCSFYGSLPLVYLFPQQALSALRGHKGFQFEDGEMSFNFNGVNIPGQRIGFANPIRNAQITLNGLCYAVIVDRFLSCWGNEASYKEFYPSIKKNAIFTMELAPADLETGIRVISMPTEKWRRPGASVHWFEAEDPGWWGVVPHVGGLHLAQLRIAERMAQKVGDKEFAHQCKQWIEAGSNALEANCWLGDYYGYCMDFETGKHSDLVFAYQLDGQWVTNSHGLEGVFRKDRIDKTLKTIKRCNVALSKSAAVNYAKADGTPYVHGWYGTYSYFPPEALMLAMTYMYEGQPEFGMELARRCWENIVCKHGYAWDMPNIMRGDQDTGQRAGGHDYYQDMMLWALPAAIHGQDIGGPVKSGGLVDRITEAGMVN